MAHLGELLAELRQDRGLTQDQLAEIISVSPVQYPITKTVDIFLIWTN